jgi:hypothetical protein
MTTTFIDINVHGWAEIELILNSLQANRHISNNLVLHLKAHGASVCIIEHHYLDRDHTDAYINYYAKQFHRHSKECKRLIFFSGDLGALYELDTSRLVELFESRQKDLLGWVVLRPVHEAPIEKIVLKHLPTVGNSELALTIRAEQKLHVLGAELSIKASILTQQDQRTGACAQAAIWSAARHIHLKHGGPWHSVSQITENAIRQGLDNLSASIPMGSEGLTLREMISATRAIGRIPLLYKANEHREWPGLKPVDVLARYIDSGIPVIAGLSIRQQGHAVAVTGLTAPKAGGLPSNALSDTAAKQYDGMLVNDDQRGANLFLPFAEDGEHSQVEYKFSDVYFFLIPLPEKVNLSAEKAETISNDVLKHFYIDSWQTIRRNEVLKICAQSSILGDELLSNYTDGKLVSRTYLTPGWKYKKRIIANSCSEEFKQLVLDCGLPKYVWITEFANVIDISAADKAQKRIYGHTVVDASAKSMGQDSVLILHIPGVSVFREENPKKNAHSFVARIIYHGNDEKYLPKAMA